MRRYIFIILLLIGCGREESPGNYQGEWCYEYCTPQGDIWGLFSIILKQEGDSIKGSHYISIMDGEIKDVGMGCTILGEISGDIAQITLKSWLADNPAEATLEFIAKDSLLFTLTKEPSNNSDRVFENMTIPHEVN